MKKAVLIIDLPENCRDCPYFGYNCTLTREKCNWYNEDGRHATCPLRELPPHKECLYVTSTADACGQERRAGKNEGWNDCLEAIIQQN